MSGHAGGLAGWFGRKKGKASVDEEKQSVTTGGKESQEPVVVWEASNQMEARVVVGRLQSEGIPAIIRGEAAGSIYGLTTGNLAAAEVLVPASLADRAIEILEANVDWDEDELDDDAGQDERTRYDSDVDADL